MEIAEGYEDKDPQLGRGEKIYQRVEQQGPIVYFFGPNRLEGIGTRDDSARGQRDKGPTGGKGENSLKG